MNQRILKIIKLTYIIKELNIQNLGECIFVTLNQEHKVRINNVLVHIENNLSLKLHVDDLSKIACFSQFHFNRVFKSVTGESVYQHIKRVRLERASYYLVNTSYSISIIALKCGFGSISSFSDSFKIHFGKSASRFRKNHITQMTIEETLDVQIKYIPKIKSAYVKNIGSFKDSKENLKTLSSWIDSLNNMNKKYIRFMRLGYDSLYITKEENFRFDLCYIIPNDMTIPQEISIKEYSEQKVASLKILGHSTVEAITESCGKLRRWIIENNYEIKNESPILIIYGLGVIHNDDEDRSKLFDMEICFPVLK